MLSHTRQYRVWEAMVRRCTKTTCREYGGYGGRGIRVCNEWLYSFEAFWNDMKDGYADHLTIDRINNNIGYEPSNCRWATYKTQAQNKRNVKIYSINGESHTLTEWGEIFNISPATIRCRINRLGWDVPRAITTPVNKHEAYKKRRDNHGSFDS